MKRIIGAAIVGAALMATMAMPAQARGDHGDGRFWLKFGSSDTGSIDWQNDRSDSPLDANTARLKLHLDEQTGDDWAFAFARGTGVLGPINKPGRHLAFDYLTTAYVGNGAPRISADIDTDGDGVVDFSAYLAAYYVTGGEIAGGPWATADFTHRTSPGVTIWADGTTFESDGTHSAWDNLAAAYPGARVIDVDLVQDEAGKAAYVDRLTIGTHSFGRMGGRPVDA